MSHHPNHLNETKTQQTLRFPLAPEQMTSVLQRRSWRKLRGSPVPRDNEHGIAGPPRRPTRTQARWPRKTEWGTLIGPEAEGTAQDGALGTGHRWVGRQRADPGSSQDPSEQEDTPNLESTAVVSPRELEGATRPRQGFMTVPNSPDDDSGCKASNSSLGFSQGPIIH